MLQKYKIHLFVELQPSRVTFAIQILQPKEPDFSKTNGLYNLSKNNLNKE